MRCSLRKAVIIAIILIALVYVSLLSHKTGIPIDQTDIYQAWRNVGSTLLQQVLIETGYKENQVRKF